MKPEILIKRAREALSEGTDAWNDDSDNTRAEAYQRDALVLSNLALAQAISDLAQAIAEHPDP